MQYTVGDLVNLLQTDHDQLIAILSSVQGFDQYGVLITLSIAREKISRLNKLALSAEELAEQRAELLSQVVIDTDVA